MNTKLFYEAPEAECMEVIAEKHFLTESLTDFEEQATMRTIEDTNHGGTWEWRN